MIASVIALTEQSAAFMRTMPDASGQIVFRTGSGPMLSLDAEGIFASLLTPTIPGSVG